MNTEECNCWIIWYEYVYFWKKLLNVLLRFPLCIWWHAWWCPRGLWDSVYFILFRLLLFFPRLDILNWPVFKFANFFFCFLKFAVSPSNKFLNFSYSTFQLQNFYLALFFTDKFYFLIDILYLVNHHSYTFFNSLDIASFRSLNIFMLVDLKIFVWKSQLLVFLRDSFPTAIPTPSVFAIVSSFFACLMHLLWKTGHFK